MRYIFDSETIQFVWTSLRQTYRPKMTIQVHKVCSRIFQKGWAFQSDVEDLVYYMDDRLGPQFDVAKVSKQLGINWEIVFYRPTSNSRSVSGFEALRIEELALLLIILERIGFQTSPSCLVDFLLPRLQSKSKTFFSNTELEIFWYYKIRHKYGLIQLQSQDITKSIIKIESFLTDSNYKIKVKGSDKANAEQIEILSPKHRKQRDIELSLCEQCGVQWHKGDPDSSSSHRLEHKRRMKYLAPGPTQEMVEERKSNNDYELVTSKSPKWKHKEMYLRALAFKREFHYDFVQWQSEKGDRDPFVQGFLFTDTLGAIVGACSFRTRNRAMLDGQWKLDWIWICPSERRKGHLTSRWAMFRNRFGDFSLTFPVSEDMKAFLKKYEDTKLLTL